MLTVARDLDESAVLWGRTVTGTDLKDYIGDEIDRQCHEVLISRCYHRQHSPQRQGRSYSCLDRPEALQASRFRLPLISTWKSHLPRIQLTIASI